MRELVNVQIGSYANHVGAHFWNLQEEYLATPVHLRELSPSVFFRERNQKCLPYAPRLQVVDLSGAFGSLSLDAGVVLPHTPEDISTDAWLGSVQTYRRDPTPVNKDEGGSYWADYLKTHLHPRSCFALPGMHAGVVEFDKYDNGTQLASSSLLDTIYDDLRVFIEDCDYLGGIHVTSDAGNGFAGLTASYLSLLRDELGSTTSIFVVGAISEPDYSAEGVAMEEQVHKRRDLRLAESRLISQCIDLSAQYVPVDAAHTHHMPYVYPNEFNMYHTSAIIALSLNVAFSPMQLPGARFSTASMCSFLRPAPFAVVSSLFTRFPMIPHAVQSDEKFSFYLRRGINNLSTRHFSSKLSTEAEPSTYLSSSQRVSEIVCSRGVRSELGIHTALNQLVTLPKAFPKFFDEKISSSGQLKPLVFDNKGMSSKTCEVEQLASLSGFATSASDGSALLRKFGAVMKQSTQKATSRHTSEKVDLLENAENLMGLAEDYGTL